MRHRIPRAGARVSALAPARALVLAVAAVGVALAGGAGCKGGGKSGAPDCKAVAAAYATLQRKEIEKPAGAAAAAAASADGAAQKDAAAQKDKALSLIPLVKEALVKECEEKKWTAETRRCAVAAASMDDLERCRTHPEAPEAPAEAPAADQGGAQAPAEAAPTPPQPEKSRTP
jgi:hypothetical protein